jgi:hypothetical protein
MSDNTDFALLEQLCHEELHSLYASPEVIRVMKEDYMDGAYSEHGRDEKCI